MMVVCTTSKSLSKKNSARRRTFSAVSPSIPNINAPRTAMPAWWMR